MYAYSHDPETGGLLLADSLSEFSKEPRPVWAAELDLLGFGELWKYDKEAAQARSEVLSEAKDFEKLDVDKLPEGVTEVYKGSDNSGYVFMLTQKGYGGDIKLICGIRPDGSIEAVKTLLHSETGGIGSKVVDNGSGYHDNYKGKTASDYASVDGVTGATISSTAYKKALGTAFEAYTIITGGAK